MGTHTLSYTQVYTYTPGTENLPNFRQDNSHRGRG